MEYLFNNVQINNVFSYMEESMLLFGLLTLRLYAADHSLQTKHVLNGVTVHGPNFLPAAVVVI